MQGVRSYPRLELTPTTTSPLAIDVSESTEMRIQRLISENPVIIFSRSSCFMCPVMKNLLSTIGVHPTVIELEEDEIGALPPADDTSSDGSTSTSPFPGGGAPVMFIGGTYVGGLKSLMALHLSGHLKSKLEEVGALREGMISL
ncbi:hypothetical protein L1049_018304 [Liquidambar formosana]|uniref:Glutaredoxin domain-containing protein n=1 Tax=Liquidambar formosana TaxID=63359 RepID=A0AAP0R9W3_LIQFO